MAPDRHQPELRASYPYAVAITTRWMDNDAYGHVNNVVYYSYFDTAANRYLIEHAGLDIQTSPVIGLVVASACHYHAPVAYPEALSAGVRVDRLGDKSVTYGIGIFREGSDTAVADGTFTHVFVDRVTRKSVSIPDAMRAALARITR
jgi:acyl-CoA thioester hydrolase